MLDLWWLFDIAYVGLESSLSETNKDDIIGTDLTIILELLWILIKWKYNILFHYILYLYIDLKMETCHDKNYVVENV